MANMQVATIETSAIERKHRLCHDIIKVVSNYTGNLEMSAALEATSGSGKIKL